MWSNDLNASMSRCTFNRRQMNYTYFQDMNLHNLSFHHIWTHLTNRAVSHYKDFNQFVSHFQADYYLSLMLAAPLVGLTLFAISADWLPWDSLWWSLYRQKCARVFFLSLLLLLKTSHLPWINTKIAQEFELKFTAHKMLILRISNCTTTSQTSTT